MIHKLAERGVAVVGVVKCVILTRILLDVPTGFKWDRSYGFVYVDCAQNWPRFLNAS